jgi:hypothetical protein
MSNLFWYAGSAGVILVGGYAAYLRWQVRRLTAQVRDLAAVKAGMASRDEKVAQLETELESEARKDHAEDVLQAEQSYY